MTDQTIFMHRIIVRLNSGPAELHVASAKGRYLSSDELSLFETLTRRIYELEGAGAGRKDTPGHETYLGYRAQRDDLGLIMPGDYGMDKRPNALLAQAFEYFMSDNEHIGMENLLRIEEAGNKYNPDGLWPEIGTDIDTQDDTLNLSDALMRPVLVNTDQLVEQTNRLSAWLANKTLSGEWYEEVAAPILRTLEAIAAHLHETGHCLITTDSDLL